VPRGWVGHSLREIDCRAHFGVTVIAVQLADQEREGYALPEPERPFAHDDRLVLAGTAAALRAVQSA